MLAPKHFLFLGDLTNTQDCPMCDGEGTQIETVWVPGQEAQEREVACYQCNGRRHVVALICGRCGEQAYASPDDLADDIQHCDSCGHHAPKILWLPMNSYHLHEKETG